MDRSDSIFMVLARRPGDAKDWDATMGRLEGSMKRAADKVVDKRCGSCQGLPPEELCDGCRNRRGNYRMINIGFTLGISQSVSPPFQPPTLALRC